MFTHDMKEKNENRVDITDIEPEVLEEMLHYIYTGYVKNGGNLSRDLLVAANEYELEDLGKICELELI